MATKANKVSLRQFQQELAQKLSSAKIDPVAAARLGVQCGQAHWLVALEDAGEIVPVPEVLPVPLTKPWYVGVTNIRGSLFSVIDFSAFTGGEPTGRGSDTRLILAGSRFGINAALLVSRMLGLRSALDLRALPVEATAPDDLPWAGQSWGEASGGANADRVWRELKFEKLIETPEFLNVGV